MRAITFHTTDGRSYRFEDKDFHTARIQYLDQNCEEIYMPGRFEVYIVKRHIASVVISD